ncbi:hypothetical protein FNV43_RR18342 [Rhamnella rubrinervis]|uniref:RNase H type-1 domain-containing protein n=1 Tax=Rhamnella rubrinervis TaxID=2594499 RepID=A0A8K0GVM3_9ROSA|nr:hypothetical protein FNV43_RR18342 [Rhamnella rubrinervis]
MMKAFKEGEAASAMVLRDSNRKVLFLASKLVKASSSPLEAELKALTWAMETAENLEWNWIVWSSDAQVLVREIKQLGAGSSRVEHEDTWCFGSRQRLEGS